jgi:uncharacterized protein (TIGR02246 family)
MKRLARVGSALALGGVIAIGCTTPPPAPDPGSAARAVAVADSTWSAAAESRDLEGSAGMIAEDGIMFPPGQPPVIGRAAAREFMRQSFAIPGFRASWVTDTVVVAASGELAYTMGRSRYIVPDTTGGLDTLYAKALGVWRRDPDGKWRAVADIWNEAPQGARIVPVAAAR